MQKNVKLAFWLIFLISLFIIQAAIPGRGLISPFVKPDLKRVTDNALYQTTGRYGIVVKNLKTGESYLKNSQEKLDPGSLYKLKLMVLTFEQIKSGKLDEDKVLFADIESLNNFFEIPREEAELKEGAIKMSVKTALEQMITISHNYAALLLTREADAGDLATPVTALEIADFFEKLYRGKVIDEDYSKKMMELLSRQKINDRIPKLLPQDVVIAHKTADLGRFEHDAGIVFTPGGDYIFVALSESNLPDAAGEKIAQLSKAVYDYFAK